LLLFSKRSALFFFRKKNQKISILFTGAAASASFKSTAPCVLAPAGVEAQDCPSREQQ
jgi:hypothetical protein